MPSRFKRIQIIVNPAAGRQRPVLSILNRVFKQYGDITWDVSITNRRGDGRRLAREAVAQGADVVAAYGGDGTVMEVAAGLVGSDVPLAILPGGTGNVMAAELGIPRRLRLSARLLCEKNQLRMLDMGRIGEHYFLMRASVGFEAKVIEKTSREMKDRFGLLAYGISIMQTLTEPLAAHYHLTIDGQPVESEGVSLLIANAGSIGRLNLSLAVTIEPDDGLLDVLIINNDPNSVLSMAASVIRLPELAASLQYWKAREVAITADPPQNVQVDGELLGQTPITATVAPGAIRVVVPERPFSWLGTIAGQREHSSESTQDAYTDESA